MLVILFPFRYKKLRLGRDIFGIVAKFEYWMVIFFTFLKDFNIKFSMLKNSQVIAEIS